MKAAAYTPPATATVAEGQRRRPPIPPRRRPACTVYFDKRHSPRSTPDAQRAMRFAAAAYIGIGTQIDITGYADKTGNAGGQRRAREEARAEPCATSS